jgi:GDPmannose 4,6-dehydratase
MNMTKVRLATGIAGQGDLHLTGVLLRKDSDVHGADDKVSALNAQRIDGACQVPQVFNNETILPYNSGLIGSFGLTREMPSGEVYSLVVRSHEAVSIESSEYIAEVGDARILQLLGVEQKVSCYQV